MGKRNIEDKRESGQNRSDNIQETKISPLHIGVNLSKAVSYEKDILNSKESLIITLQHLNNYRKLREKELDRKVDMRDTLKEVYKILDKIKKNLPIMAGEEKKKALKTGEEWEESPEIETPEVAETYEEKHKMTSLERELLEIKRKLESLSSVREI